MAEVDDYLTKLRQTGSNSSIQPSLSIDQKERQGIKMEPTDDSYLTTHRPPQGNPSGN